MTFIVCKPYTMKINILTSKEFKNIGGLGKTHELLCFRHVAKSRNKLYFFHDSEVIKSNFTYQYFDKYFYFL